MSSREEYENRAVELATHPEQLQALHERVRAARGSALFDIELYVEHLATGMASLVHPIGFKEALRRHKANLPPTHIDILALVKEKEEL